MYSLIVTVVILLNGQPFGDPQRFTRAGNDGSPTLFQTHKACLADIDASIPAFIQHLEAQIGGRRDEAFRADAECVSQVADNESADRAADGIAAILRAMNLRGGFPRGH